MSSFSSRSSTPTSGLSKLPPIITNEADREFLYELNGFIDRELNKINPQSEEQRYLVYKSVFNKVIEHVTSYKTLLTAIKKEYEDTIETIRTGQREAVFLQGKLKAMASEPSTLRNYKKRADELEERISIIRKENDRLHEELQELKAEREEREKKPEMIEPPKREVKKDRRQIPGLTLEEATDLPTLHKKNERLERTLKELNISLKTRFLPKTQKLQLKDTLENKVNYRDQLLWQSQVFKARGQRLKIALEAAQAYNRVKPPHQTVGDAVMLAFQHALGAGEKEQTAAPTAAGDQGDGTSSEPTQSSTFEDDDPNKEKEAEMMLEYIEKFNELFEDSKFEEAAIHAANSPKGILRTQATLAKFRDVKAGYQGRSPLLAFCDAMMSSVKSAASRPNEGLSLDCAKAGLNENRLDLIYHWLTQDKLTPSVEMGQLIRDHCSCKVPCMCGAQALAQHVFQHQRSHPDIMLCLLQQGKVQMALQHAQAKGVLDQDVLLKLLAQCPSVQLVDILLKDQDAEEGVGGGSKGVKGGGPLLPMGVVLVELCRIGQWEMGKNWLQKLVYTPLSTKPGMPRGEMLHKLVSSDDVTSHSQWMELVKQLQTDGHEELSLQLMAVVTVAMSMKLAFQTLHDESDINEETLD
ncbi:clathrin heavy chain linker domain-containing protein 1-like isoform X2 [Babylonia areolata]|uniref:clathrin heavy chain linker domain-containing protein 1-like isoform X2 n=1 Tax=Babylonia areolata TaxID=304850 RepID=UPI003FCFBDB3